MSATRPEQLSCPTCHAANKKGLRKKVRVKKGINKGKQTSPDRLQCAECGHNQPINIPPPKNIANKRTDVDNRWTIGGQSTEQAINHARTLNYDLSDKRILKIIRLIRDGHHELKIAKRTKIPRSTVRNIITFLISVGKIEPLVKTNMRVYPKAYRLIEQVDNLNIYNVKPSTDVDSSNIGEILKVARHSSSWRTKILAHPQTAPIPEKYYHPRGWTGSKAGRVYDDPLGRGKIRIIPGNNMFFDFDREFIHKFPLEEEGVMTAKLHDMATASLSTFSKENGYQIGTVVPSRDTTEIPLPKEIRDVLSSHQTSMKVGGATIEINKSGEEEKRGLEISMNRDDPTGISKTELTSKFIAGILQTANLPETLRNHEMDTSSLIEQGNKHLTQTLEQTLSGAIQALTPVLLTAFKAQGEENMKLLIAAVTAPHILQEIAKKQVEDLKETMKKQIEEEMRKMQQTGTTEPDKKMYG